MNAPSTPEGPGSVSGAPHLPDGFTGTFTSRYIGTGDLRQHVVTGGDGRRSPRATCRAWSFPVAATTASRRLPRRYWPALTAFLAPCRDGPAAAHNP